MEDGMPVENFVGTWVFDPDHGILLVEEDVAIKHCDEYGLRDYIFFYRPFHLMEGVEYGFATPSGHSLLPPV